jgi:hypothetical protein
MTGYMLQKHRVWLHVSALLGAAMCARGDVVEQGPKDSRPSGLLAGVARTDITPPSIIAHLNWGSQTHVESAGTDPAGMTATAIVLSDGRQRFAIVDVDCLSASSLEAAIPKAAQKTGIPEDHIRINATHTHSGPAFQASKGPVGKDPAQFEPLVKAHSAMIREKIVAVIVEAAAKLRPVHAYGSKGTGSINMNRRVRASGDIPPSVGTNPDGFVDRDLVVVRIDDAQGKPYAVLVNFQCHGTVLTYENKLISPDWIGMVRKTIESAIPGVTALYLQGAAGNQGPMEGGTGDVRVAHRLGTILGLEAAALAMRTDTVRREKKIEGYIESTAFGTIERWRVSGPRDATMKFAKRTLELPARQYTARDIDRMATLSAEARRNLDAANQSGDEWQKHQAEARLRRWADLLERYKRPVAEKTIAVDVQALRIGDIAIVAMPGEPFAEIGAAIKKDSPFPITLFCGYSNGKGGGYMPVEPEYSMGGYEVDMTPYASGAAGQLVREMSGLLESLR